MSSQWPVVVSLPRDRSTSRPATAGAPGCGGHPSSGSTFPRPSASSVGRSRPPTAFATLPRVLDPASPKSAASGSSPAPTASRTITHARDTRSILVPVETALGLIALVIFIACVVALAASVTWLVVKLSPAPGRKKKKQQEPVAE